MHWGALNMQNMSSLLGRDLDLFHDYICGILLFILFLVGYLLSYLCFTKWLVVGLVEAPFLEFVWTLFPMGTLFLIGLPSMYTLYSHEVELQSDLTLKVVGHQWYWGYDYSGLGNVEFDSFMLPLSDLSLGDFRLLDVDNRVVLPVNSRLRIAITSSDVLHSWALPSLGLKADANPGRLNFMHVVPLEVGLFFGQCSEICGANHSFMPVCLEVVPPILFGGWISLF